MKLTRFSGNPVISPSKNWWETKATFNPGVTAFQDKIVLLYRSLGGDSISRFGWAESSDGIHFKRNEDPVFEGEAENPYERLGVEDPRISLIEGTYYICYTAPSVYPASVYHTGKFAPSIERPAPWRVRPSLLTTVDFKTFERKGILIDIDTKDAAFFPEKIAGNWALLHRAYPNLYLAASRDLKNWERQFVLASPRENSWDQERVGAGAPPLKTEKGWLLFYHGTSKNHQYMIGVLILDLADPTKILYRSSEPLLVPETNYEKEGLTPNVVFTCGAIEWQDHYLVYYGAADKVIGLAYIMKEELLNSLQI